MQFVLFSFIQSCQRRTGPIFQKLDPSNWNYILNTDAKIFISSYYMQGWLLWLAGSKSKAISPLQTIKFKKKLVWTDHKTRWQMQSQFTQRYSPSSGTTVRVTTLPASLISWTMSLWESSMMERPLTAEIRSPTCSRPQRSVGLPSMMRPILCGITETEDMKRNEALTPSQSEDYTTQESLEKYQEC